MSAYHAIPRIFGLIHSRASHGKGASVQRRWASAEAALLKHYCPALSTMVKLGIKSERV
jgi:hypothetical protein